MSIWRQRPELEALNAMAGDTLVAHLDIRFTEVGEDYVVATMPVDARTHQPFGLLHGGASAVLAETLGSMGANYCLDQQSEYAVGLEINANHLRPVRSGRVTGTARPLHVGRRTQVWETRIEDEAARLVCVSRLTLAVVPREPK
ncbi:hotdog fold thioesterase [Wenzhouxiangella sp. XN24]|uniref:hotdog fold thioesterase n=1 Tax=Wenzhouxiangella sp. XN24 TaxID=2713569 RepID=UPI0013EB888B|nr:hotdog fold thioesterase [Wenzhouxiangella sp. XN24]NGX17310.1 hotdog fold thioesterase [Wenzhouxiangella sp. XN24]